MVAVLDLMTAHEIRLCIVFYYSKVTLKSRCTRVKKPVGYTFFCLDPLTTPHYRFPSTQHQSPRKSRRSHSFLIRTVVRQDQSSNTLSTILQTTVKILFVLPKPPPLVQITQLVPTSCCNLKTTSQSSTTT